MDYRQVYAIEKANKERILKVCPNCPDTSGIYILTREEDGFKWAYIGQAKHLLSRLAGHLRGYQHIDLSLKKHKLYSEENPHGWRVHFLEFPECELDEHERYYIRLYANSGYQLRNHESGGKEGKVALEGRQQGRGYYDGLEQGKKKIAKDLFHIIEKHLDVKPKNGTKTAQKGYDKFFALLNNYAQEEKQDELQ